jgi:hypothetical protein
MLLKKKSKNNLKMNKTDLKKDKIKISKMIMINKMKKEMVMEMEKETKIANLQKPNLIEVLPKNFLAMIFMIKIDFIEITVAQYLREGILEGNLSRDRA